MARRTLYQDEPLMTRIVSLVPERVRIFLTERIMEAAGIAMLLLAISLAAAALSFSPTDPSFNVATDRDADNLFGAPGAAIADLSLQLIGLGLFGVVFPMSAWALWLAVFKVREGIWAALPLRCIATVGGVSALSAAAACLPIPARWPYATGLGGVLGDALTLPVLAPLTGLGLATAQTGLGMAMLGVGLAAMVYGAGFTPADAAAAVVEARRLIRSLTRRLAGKPAEDPVERAPAPRPRRTAKPRVEPGTPPEAAAAYDAQPDLLDEDDASEDKRPVRISRPAPKAPPSRKTHAGAPLDLDPTIYQLPPLTLLAKPKQQGDLLSRLSDDTLQENARQLERVLQDFGIKGEIIGVKPGPVVTLYELEPAPGIKSSRVIGLADDIARSMSAISARVAVVAGRNVIGIELPNDTREMVLLRDLLSTEAFETNSMQLPLALGKTIGGEPVISDIARMPHLLIAGTTGSGKSVAINTMILSLLFRLPPDRCKLIMVDPKMLELSVYDGIPHLLAPVVTDPRKAVVALKWVVREMEGRYRKMSKIGVRNIKGFNERVAEAAENGETLTRRVQTGFDKESGTPVFEEEVIDLKPMPFMVVIIDEMADLMMVAGKEIENAVQRLAQMARAAGIHIITATQRPSVDVITGTIKANFPTRISFQVTSKIDSRTILGEQGAEQLLGQGDMLYMAGGGRITRVHGPFVSDDEVEKVVAFLKKQGKPEYLEEITEDPDEGITGDMLGFGGDEDGGSGDDLYDRAVAVVARDRKASTSYIQRKLMIGYNRAARLVERMEEEGVVSAPNHVGKREILLPDHGDRD